MVHMLLLDDNTWTIDAKVIRQAFTTHFKNIYCEQDSALASWPVEVLQALQETVPKVNAENFEHLEAIPTPTEIEEAVFSLGPDRAPGPNGINARFIQTLWPSIKSTVVHEVTEFFLTSNMPVNISKSNMILIPKKANPQNVTDYRPISICNVIYKVISKILARRLKPIIPLLIHQNQVAFTPGRNIANQIILMREIMHTFKQASFNKAAFCLKSDLSKAFDCMSWGFIENALSSCIPTNLC